VKPPFEDEFPVIEKLIQTHKWRQQLPGLELEDLEQQMRLLAYKAWTRWDPERGPLKVLWWRYVVNWRCQYLKWYDHPKRKGVKVSLDMPINEEESTSLIDLRAADELPEYIECPSEVPLYRQLWFLMQHEFTVAEIRVLTGLTPNQYMELRNHMSAGDFRAPEHRRHPVPGQLTPEVRGRVRLQRSSANGCPVPVADKSAFLSALSTKN
jgi:hypothetical protein